jgi:hypothetical protein
MMPTDQKWSVGAFLFDADIQTFKEIVVSTLVNLTQFNDYADTDIEFARFILRISGPTYIATSALQLSAQLLLG